MSKEKQIEEMWDIITTDCDRECVGCEFENDKWCFTRFVINKLYNAGYRKQSEGEWKWISDDDCICSACGKVFYSADNADAGTSFWKYCPNCGAKMKGGE